MTGRESGVRVAEIAKFLSSKNAGPFLVCIDIVFFSRGDFLRFIECPLMDRDVVAGILGLEPAEVLDIVRFEPALAVKVVIQRRVPAGSFGDSDVYGAQFHAPYADSLLEW